VTSPFTTGELVQISCIWEATARKVGNVHRCADFQHTNYLDFILSAAAAAPHFNDPALSVGEMILRAVNATNRLVGQNTNLGIVLLLAPLCAVEKTEPFKLGLERVLSSLSQRDAKLVFEAIRLAKPGGLGEAAKEDIRNDPTVTLSEAMRLAADRDLIARQYANGFSDVFDFGLPAFLNGIARFDSVEAATVDLQIRLLAKYPDSLIARKNGPAVAEEVRMMAAEIQKSGGVAVPEGRKAGIQLDRYLRSRGNKLNPGTTADLISACLFVALRENEVIPTARFPWHVEDWL
jgi:triphosphoribosyl-dephospho-CoA synthase